MNARYLVNGRLIVFALIVSRTASGSWRMGNIWRRVCSCTSQFDDTKMGQKTWWVFPSLSFSFSPYLNHFRDSKLLKPLFFSYQSATASSITTGLTTTSSTTLIYFTLPAPSSSRVIVSLPYIDCNYYRHMLALTLTPTSLISAMSSISYRHHHTSCSCLVLLSCCCQPLPVVFAHVTDFLLRLL